MTGQQEKISYRVVRSSAEDDESFLPAQGVGAGVSEGLGIVLNRMVKRPPKFRPSHQTVIGTVVADTRDYVTLELRDGHKLKIPTSNIILRKAVKQ